MLRVRLPETLSGRTIADLERALANPPGALILEGVCAGMDFESFLEGDAGPWLDRFANLVHGLRTLSCPTVAVVDGAMIGGGVGLAAACDVVVATPHASFALPEGLFGFFPGVVVPCLLHRMSPHAIQLFAMAGTARSAEWAVSVGLVDEVSSTTEASASRWIRSLSRCDRRRIAGIREWTAHAGSLGASAFRAGAERSADAFADPRARELARAFLHEGGVPWQR